MKKIICCLLMLFCTFAIFGCGDDKSNAVSNKSSISKSAVDKKAVSSELEGLLKNLPQRRLGKQIIYQEWGKDEFCRKTGPSWYIVREENNLKMYGKIAYYWPQNHQGRFSRWDLSVFSGASGEVEYEVEGKLNEYKLDPTVKNKIHSYTLLQTYDATMSSLKKGYSSVAGSGTAKLIFKTKRRPTSYTIEIDGNMKKSINTGLLLYEKIRLLDGVLVK